MRFLTASSSEDATDTKVSKVKFEGFNGAFLIYSPPLRVPNARQTVRSIVLVGKRTEPSIIADTTPPGCLLLAETCIDMFVMVPGNGIPAQENEFGVATWL